MQYCCSGWKCQEGSASLALSCVFLSLPKYSSYFKTVTISLYSFQCLCLVNLLMSLLLWVKLTPFSSVMDNCPTTGSSQTPLPDLTLLVPLFAINRGSMLSIFFLLHNHIVERGLNSLKNTKYVCSIFGYTAHGYADVGNSVLLHLNEDDAVSLKAHPSYSTTIHGTGHV